MSAKRAPHNVFDDSPDLPEILYKYRCWDDRQENMYQRTLLTNNNIYFAKPSSFNDPFDSRIALRLDKARAGDKRDLLLKRIRQDYPGISSKEAIPWVRKRVLELNDPANVRKEHARQRQMIDDGFGVLPLTAARDNLVMWAHYAGSHTGFCVGIYTESLLKCGHRLFVTSHHASMIRKVNYDDDYPVVDPFGPDYVKGTWGWIAATTKSGHWKYEQEYRFILCKPGADRSHVLPDEAFAAVFS